MIFIFILLSCFIRYSFSEEWTIHVYTGIERFAGTDANVFIQMFNSINGYTKEYELTHENWLYGDSLFAYKDLFERGEHDRFRISTGPFKFVEKIHVRHSNLPMIRSDWFLDRIIVERNRDSTKFTFPCACWLRTEQPYITISVLSDLYSNDKNKFFKDNQIIIIILLIFLPFAICLIYSLREYCCCLKTRIVHTENEFPILDRSYPLLPEPSAPPLALHVPNYFISLTSTQQILPYNHHYSRQVVITQSTDEPPAYRDLFPD